MTNNFKPNDAQRRAIEFPIDTPLKVVAGAGTGKTAVLTERFVRIVENHGIPPSRILALTFTKKAAAEMRRRIVNELFRKNLLNRSEAPLLFWIGNFHSTCLRLLRQYALVAGLDPSFGNIDEGEQRLLLAGVVTEFLNGKLGGTTEPGGFESLMIERAEDFTRNVSGVVSRLKSQFVDLEAHGREMAATLEADYRNIESNLSETAGNRQIHASTRKAAERRLESLPAAKARERLFLAAVSEIRTAYERVLEDRDKLDFNDLISHACRLAEAEPSVRKRFDYILVDEFQDTDGAQFRLLEALSDGLKNVTVVCDRKQSIYEWREARLENIDEFVGESIFLDENYRSVGEILDAGNYFIAQTMENEKELTPAADGGRGRAGEPCVRLFRASCREEEADYAASEIERLLERYAPEEIAILMRSVRASGHIENALRAREIPYNTVGGRGFHDLSETKDLLALLRVIENPFDDVSMARVLQCPIVGLSDAALHALRRQDGASRGTFYDSLRERDHVLDDLDPHVRGRARVCVEAIGDIVRERWSMTIAEIVSETLARTNYFKYLASVEGTRGPRFSNVSRFYKKVALFEERNPGAALADCLTYMETVMESDSGASAASSAGGVVRIMTVHQAKGLEFPVVFVMNLKKGGSGLPLKYRGGAFGFDERFGVFVAASADRKPLVRHDGGYGVNIKETLKSRQSGEENRVMYVAMTRAERLLYLTTPQPEIEDDFFTQIEEFASGDGADSVEVVSSYERPPGLKDNRIETATALSEGEIGRAAKAAVDRIRVAAPAAPEAAKPVVSLSYSRLALFRQCPAKYRLRHVYGLPLQPHEESLDETPDHIDAFTLGNLMHDTLMHFHRRNRSGASADAGDILTNLSASLPPSVAAAAREMLRKYLDHPLARTQTLYEEREFNWKIADESVDVFFRGKIDRIHDEGGLLKIVDYKTGARRADSHKAQLGMYKLAMEEALDTREMLTGNFYLSTGEEVECEFSAEDLRDIRQEIVDDARRIAAGDFSVPEGVGPGRAACDNCGYKGFCGYGRDEAAV